VELREELSSFLVFLIENVGVDNMRQAKKCVWELQEVDRRMGWATRAGVHLPGGHVRLKSDRRFPSLGRRPQVALR
jgi:hypothetical protein